MPTLFPNNDFERKGKLINQLGSFWTSVFDDLDFVENLMNSKTEEAKHTFQITKENLASVSRLNVPVHSSSTWKTLTLVSSQRQEGTLVEYGDSFVFGPQAETGQTLEYGISPDRSSAFPLPIDIKDIGAIVNKRQDTDVIFSKNVDYYIDTKNNLIIFRENPLDNELVKKEKLFDANGNETDQQAVIWLNEVKTDKNHIHNQFGYILSLFKQSSEEYRTLVNRLFDNLMFGNSYDALVYGLALLADVPVALENGEIVRDIKEMTSNLLIITNSHVYTCHKDSVPSVDVGDMLSAGQILTNTVKITPLHEGVIPSTLEAMAVGPGLLIGAEFDDELIFENKVVATTVTLDVDGKTSIEWEITGSAQDVDLFWDTVHANGVASGETIANLLDTRSNKVGEPTASNLPSTINPLEFLVTNMFRNIILVELDANTFGSRALGLNSANILRRLVPPQYLAVLITTLSEAEVDSYTGSIGTDLTAYYSSGDTVVQTTSATTLGLGSLIFS